MDHAADRRRLGESPPWDVAKPYKDAIIRRGDRYNIIEANSWHMSTYYGIPAEHVDTRAARERLGID